MIKSCAMGGGKMRKERSIGWSKIHGVKDGESKEECKLEEELMR